MKYKINFDINLEGKKLSQFLEDVKGNMKCDVEVEMDSQEFIETMGTIKELVTFVTKEMKEINKENFQRSPIIEDLNKKSSENTELRHKNIKLEREIKDLQDKIKEMEDKDDNPLI